ncbi:MAG TPA: hypothetical protein VK327_10900 [Candidatus Paceibacterota bacterium]|nr:hypothetical protein [Candidatus Paceibacterota bacterium]
MKGKLNVLSQHHATASKKHLKHGQHVASTGLRSALTLGLQAISLGLDTNHRAERLAATNRSLRLGITRHKTMEAALRKHNDNSRKLLEESHHVQKHLQHLTHELLAAQEDKRRKLSSSLQNEIAQTLLGINVRLLTLKRETAFNATGFKKDIAGTQRLVKQSIQSINQFAHELDIHA